MTGVKDYTREVIWKDFTDAERYLRYYMGLTSKYRRKHRDIRMSLLTLALTEAVIAAPLLTNLPTVYGVGILVIMGVAILVLTMFDALLNYGETAARLAIISEALAVINTDWRSLWVDIETYVIEETDARARQRTLLDQTNRFAALIELDHDDKLNEELESEAVNVMRGRYAGTS